MTQDQEFQAVVSLLEDHGCDTENVMLFDGRGMGYTYLDALIGTSHEGHPIYDYNKMVECLVKDGMTELEAIEWIDYNTIGSLCGIDRDGYKWPIIMYPFEEVER